MTPSTLRHRLDRIERSTAAGRTCRSCGGTHAPWAVPADSDRLLRGELRPCLCACCEPYGVRVAAWLTHSEVPA